jgi:hypothetical protein
VVIRILIFISLLSCLVPTFINSSSSFAGTMCTQTVTPTL